MKVGGIQVVKSACSEGHELRGTPDHCGQLWCSACERWSTLKDEEVDITPRLACGDLELAAALRAQADVAVQVVAAEAELTKPAVVVTWIDRENVLVRPVLSCGLVDLRDNHYPGLKRERAVPGWVSLAAPGRGQGLGEW